ncbi:MAG: chromate transporter [Bacillota bacterium]
MIYLELFWSFFQIGIFTIGGGYAALPLIQHHIVDAHNYLTLYEFIDIITIAESTPGPIAINAATFVGVRTAGILGAIICTLGIITPSLIIVLLLGKIYSKYSELQALKRVLRVIRPIAIALISAAAATILLLVFFDSKSVKAKNFDFITLGLFTVSIFILRKFKLNPIWVMLGSGVVGGIIYMLL